MADARRAVRELLEGQNLEAQALVLVACSGGADSMALAAATAFEAPRLGLRAGAVIVDHSIQEGSHEVASQAAERCQALGLDPVVIEQVEVENTGAGLEAAARDARYEALGRARELLGAELILLGHNQDDQAETVLLGLARGSGLRSISGMPALDAERRVARPLIDIPRATLRQACLDQGVDFWDDPQNLDDRFSRVRVRKQVEQLEKTLGPGYAAALARTAQSAFEADDLISKLAEELAVEAKEENEALTLSTEVLEQAHEAIRRKTILHICQRAGAKSVSRQQVLEVEALVLSWHGQKPLSLSGITVERVANHLVFKKD